MERLGLFILLQALLLFSSCHALSWKKSLAHKILAPASLVIATATGVPHHVLAVPLPLSAIVRSASTSVTSGSLTSLLTIAQVDNTPLDPRKLVTEDYREQIKLKIEGLKKLIKAEDWAAIQQELNYYEPLFEVGALSPDDFESYSDSDIAETTRKSLTKAFYKLDEIAQGSEAKKGPTKLAGAVKTYRMIEGFYDNISRSYGGGHP